MELRHLATISYIVNVISFQALSTRVACKLFQTSTLREVAGFLRELNTFLTSVAGGEAFALAAVYEFVHRFLGALRRINLCRTSRKSFR